MLAELGSLAPSMENLPAIVVALTTLISALTAAIVAIINSLKVSKIHHEVKTQNELTIGQLAEAVETRRITGVAKEDRTAREQRHLEGDYPGGSPLTTSNLTPHPPVAEVHHHYTQPTQPTQSPQYPAIGGPE